MARGVGLTRSILDGLEARPPGRAPRPVGAAGDAPCGWWVPPVTRLVRGGCRRLRAWWAAGAARDCTGPAKSGVADQQAQSRLADDWDGADRVKHT